MERFRSVAYKGFELLANSGYNIETINSQNLDVLQKGPDSPCVLYFNHTVPDDPILSILLIQSNAPQRINNLIIPVSEHYMQFRNFFMYASAVRIGRSFGGIEMPEIVQSYRKRGDGRESLQSKSESLNLTLVRLFSKKMSKGPVILISPEGHRSDSGSLLPAETGIGSLAKLMQNAKMRGEIDNGYFIPLAIVIKDRRDPDLLNFSFKGKPEVKLTVGEAIDVDKVITESRQLGPDTKQAGAISHYLMSRLAGLLPPQMRGFYDSERLADTASGRYEQREWENGTVRVYDKKLKRFS